MENYNGFIVGKKYKKKNNSNTCCYFCGLDDNNHPVFELDKHAIGVIFTKDMIPSKWVSKGTNTYWRYKNLDLEFDPTPIEEKPTEKQTMTVVCTFSANNDFTVGKKYNWPYPTDDNGKKRDIKETHFKGHLWHFELVKEKEEKVKELTSLPEKWCIKTTPNTRKEVQTFIRQEGYQAWLDEDFYIHYPFTSSGGSAYVHKQPEYVEITYDQFKKWVLKDEKKPEMSIEAIQEECKKRFPIGCTFKDIENRNVWTLKQDPVVYKPHGNERIFASDGCGLLYKEGIFAELLSLPQEEYIPQVGDWVVILRDNLDKLNGKNIVGKLVSLNHFRVRFDGSLYKDYQTTKEYDDPDFPNGYYEAYCMSKPALRKALEHEIPLNRENVKKHPFTPDEVILGITPEQLLEKAARDYPIGTIYKDAEGRHGECKVRYDPKFVSYNNIEAGLGYVYFNGRWAEIVSKPAFDHEKIQNRIDSINSEISGLKPKTNWWEVDEINFEKCVNKHLIKEIKEYPQKQNNSVKDITILTLEDSDGTINPNVNRIMSVKTNLVENN